MKSALLAEGNHGWEKIITLHKQRIATCKNMSEIVERQVLLKIHAELIDAIKLCISCQAQVQLNYTANKK